MTRDEMLAKLREGYCTVTFNKVSGEERVMDCTLNMDMIPAEAQPKTDGNAPVEGSVNESVVKVYDVRAAGWRSFKVDSVTNFV